MRLAIEPLTFVLSSVLESHYSLTLLVVFIVLALILVTVWISDYPQALHFALFPIPFINKTICPFLHTFALRAIVKKVSSVGITVWPGVCTMPMLFTVSVITAAVVFINMIDIFKAYLNIIMTSMRNISVIKILVCFFLFSFLGHPVLFNFVSTNLTPVICVFCQEFFIIILVISF